MNPYARSWAFVRVMSYNAGGFGFVSSRRSPCPEWILCLNRRTAGFATPGARIKHVPTGNGGTSGNGWSGAIERASALAGVAARSRTCRRWCGALLGLAIAVVLLTVRATHAERIFPDVTVANVPVGGMPIHQAAVALAERAEAIESSPITFIHEDRTWTATLRDVGVSIDENEALERAVAYGREDSAFRRLRSVAALARSGEQLAMPLSLDYQQLDRWFDEIDRGLGTPPRNASVEIQGTNVVILPEVDGVVVDRDRARAEVESQLLNLTPIEAELPIATKIATIARPTWNRRVSCCCGRCRTRFRSPTRAVSGPCRRPISRSSCGKTWS